LTQIAPSPWIEWAQRGNRHEHGNPILEPQCPEDTDQAIDSSAFAGFQAGDNTARDAGLRRNIVLAQVA
jgi:hypothetical protein